MKSKWRLKDNLHVIWLLFWPFQTIWYSVLTKYAREMPRFFTIHCGLDDLIPFAPCFVVFYLLWYLYIAGAMIWFAFVEKEGFYKLITFLYIEITLTLLIGSIFPNGHDMRPVITGSEGIFEWMVNIVYSNDSSCATILPSMHVMNAVGISIAVSYSPRLCKKKLIPAICWTYTVLVTMSVVLIKQHSIIDVFAALGVCLVLYLLIYRPKLFKKIRNK